MKFLPRPGKISRSSPGGSDRDLWSLENLTRAWRKVRANSGCPGVDKVSIEEFERDLADNLAALQRDLRRRSYRPMQVKRVYVPKPKGGLRPLAILALRDRVVQRVVYDYLDPLFDPHFLDCSYGFRRGRSVRDAVARVLAYRDAGCRWVADADIQECFENVNHKLLMYALRQRVRDRQVLELVEAWLKARVFNELGGVTAGAGTPQGAVLSPLLANIYLDGFDRQMVAERQRLVRYADDFAVLCRCQEDAEKALKVAERALGRLGLRLNPYKTRVTGFDQGFCFLGVFFLRDEHFYL
jgi:group II intron reverse transcriptase/maturase